MLADEAQFRVDLLGEWTKPWVKREARWRFESYRWWLDFLDEGIPLMEEWRASEPDLREDWDKQQDNIDDALYDSGLRSRDMIGAKRSIPDDYRSTRRDGMDEDVEDPRAERYNEWLMAQLIDDGWTTLDAETEKSQKMLQTSSSVDGTTPDLDWTAESDDWLESARQRREQRKLQQRRAGESVERWKGAQIPWSGSRSGQSTNWQREGWTSSAATAGDDTTVVDQSLEFESDDM